MKVAKSVIAAVFAAGVGFAGTAAADQIDTWFDIAAPGYFTATDANGPTNDLLNATTLTGSQRNSSVTDIVRTDNTGLTVGTAVDFWEPLLPDSISIAKGAVDEFFYATPVGNFYGYLLTVSGIDLTHGVLGTEASGTISEIYTSSGATLDDAPVEVDAFYSHVLGSESPITGWFDVMSSFQPPPLSSPPPPDDVPEPAAIALFGAALAGLGAARRGLGRH
jgi:hypothetical protein